MRLQMNVTKNLDKKRWLALFGGVLMMSTLGFGFIWSLMVDPMINLRGATDAQMATVYSGLTITGALLTIIGGKLVDKIGSTKVLISAIIALLIGELLCMIPGLAGFAIAQCVFISWQAAVVYIAVYANIIKLFPDWQGLAIAITCAGISIGGAYLPPIVQRAIDTFGFDRQFLVIGFMLTAIGFIALVIFPEAPEGYCPKGYEMHDWDAEDGCADDDKFIQKDWKMMLKDPVFYLVFLAPIFGSATYMLLTYQMAWIAQDILSVTEMQAAFLVSGVSIAGIACGICGPIADKVNRLGLMTVLYTCGTLCTLGLISCNSHGVAWFTVFALGFCFFMGGAAGVHPVVISSLFGTKNFGFNYSICYQSVLIAAAISPWLGVIGRANAGDYSFCFKICTVLCAIGAIMFAIIFTTRRNKLEPRPQKEKK